MASAALDQLVEERNALSNLCKTPDLQSVAYVNLALNDAQLTHLNGLEEYPFLQSVHLRKNDLTNETISSFGLLEHLRVVDLSENALTSAPQFKAARALQQLDISRNQIREIENLSSQRYLEAVFLRDNSITSLAPLGELKYLQTLDAAQNNIVDVSVIKSDCLCKLIVDQNEVESVAGIHSFPRLRLLSLGRNKLTNLAGISRLQQLVVLNVQNNNVQSLDNLQELCGLVHLNSLDLRGNPIQQTPQYRLRVIFLLPQLNYLDDVPVTAAEKFESQELHNIHKHAHISIEKHYLPEGRNSSRDRAKLARALAGQAIYPEPSSTRVLPDASWWALVAETGMLTEWERIFDACKAVRPEQLQLSQPGLVLGDVGWWAVGKLLAENPQIKSLQLAGTYGKSRWSAKLSNDIGLRALTDAIASHPSLEVLDLSDCYIGRRESEVLAAGIATAPALTTVKLRNNNLNESLVAADTGVVIAYCPGFEAIVSAVAENQRISDVDFSFNQLSDHAAKHIASALTNRKAQHIRSLVLDGNSLGAEGGLQVAEALRKNTSLLHLSLKGGLDRSERVDGSFLSWLFLSLWKYNRTLKRLDVSGCVLDNTVANAVARALAFQDCSLTSLSLNDTSMDSDALQIVADGLKKNRSLQSLDVGNNKSADCFAVGRLFVAASVHPSLSRLGASNLSIGDDIAEPLASWLTSPTSQLTNLDVSRNIVGERGEWQTLSSASCERLAAAFGSAKRLESLNVSGLGLTAEVTASIAGLAQDSSLTSLHAGGNEWPEHSLSILTSAVRQSQTLKELSLTNTEWPTKSATNWAAELARAVSASSTLALWDLSENPLQARDIEGLAQGLSSAAGALKVLRLRGSFRDGETTTASTLLQLWQSLANSSTIEDVDLSGNQFTEQDLATAADLLSRSSSLKSLDLRGSAASTQTYAAISSMLGGNESLTHLKLPDHIGYDELTAEKLNELVSLISSGLMQNRAVQSISFGRLFSDGLGAEAVRTVLSALQQGSNISLRAIQATEEAYQHANHCSGEGCADRETDVLYNALSARLATNTIH